MAVAGGGIPSASVCLDTRKRDLVRIGTTCNVREDRVQSDMAFAAEWMRRNPGAGLRIDMRHMNYIRLREFLIASGDVVE